MDGEVDGCMDGWMDGRTDEWRLEREQQEAFFHLPCFSSNTACSNCWPLAVSPNNQQ